MNSARTILVAALLFGTALSSLKATFPTLALKPLSRDEIHAPTAITHAGDGSGRLFVCEQQGLIRIVRNGMLLPTPFLNLASKMVNLAVGYDERGLLGLAFHPDYENSAAPGYRKFYVYYSAVSPTGSTTTNPVNNMCVIAEYKVSASNPDVADPLSARIVLTFNHPQSNHNGGQIEFGPTDQWLYIASGDGGSSDDNNYGHTGGNNTKPNGPTVLGNSQDKTRLLGKILRIDPLGTDGLAGPGNAAGTYGIPPSNPFVGAGGGVREEIYAFGVRNPFRFSFDVGPGGTNRLFCGDVGQNKVEEVDIIVAGGNYGWRIMEANIEHDILAPSGGGVLIPPIAEYAHPGVVAGTPALPQIGVSLAGGYVYRGLAIPALVGKYVFGDYSTSASVPSGILLGLEESAPLSGSFSLSTLNITGGNPIPTRIYTFGRDEAGELYVGTKTTNGPVQLDPGTSKPGGAIFKIVDPTAASPTRREAWLQQYFAVGHFVDDFADLDGDGIGNQFEYAFAYSPLAANAPGFNVATASAGASITFTMTFRRDPRATDLTYLLQTSDDLITWTTIVSSVGGAVASGPQFVSETDIAGETPLKLVTGSETIPDPKRFARLRVIRQL